MCYWIEWNESTKYHTSTTWQFASIIIGKYLILDKYDGVDNGIKKEGMEILYQYFRNYSFFFSSLTILDLTSIYDNRITFVDNDIRVEGMIYLTLMIKNNNFPYLQELSLVSNRIQDTGMLEFISLLKYHFLPNLQILYLTDNGLNDESIQEFIPILDKKCVASNMELYLGCNKISRPVIQLFVDRLSIRGNEKPLKFVAIEKSNCFLIEYEK